MTVAFATGAHSAGCDGWTSIDWTVVYQHVHRLQVRIAKAVEDAAGSLKRPLKGLSCLLGNWHGQFLEGWGLVTAPGYSARCLPIEEMVPLAERSGAGVC